MYIMEVDLTDNSVWLLLAPVEDFQKAYERRSYAVHVPIYDDENATKIRNLLIEKRRKCYLCM
jgi:hypothetical protein